MFFQVTGAFAEFERGYDPQLRHGRPGARQGKRCTSWLPYGRGWRQAMGSSRSRRLSAWAMGPSRASRPPWPPDASSPRCMGLLLHCRNGRICRPPHLADRPRWQGSGQIALIVLCPLSSHHGRSDMRHRVFEAVVQGGNGAWRGWVGSRLSGFGSGWAEPDIPITWTFVRLAVSETLHGRRLAAFGRKGLTSCHPFRLPSVGVSRPLSANSTAVQLLLDPPIRGHLSEDA
jgi:hypothetical protein